MTQQKLSDKKIDTITKVVVSATFRGHGFCRAGCWQFKQCRSGIFSIRQRLNLFCVVGFSRPVSTRQAAICRPLAH